MTGPHDRVQALAYRLVSVDDRHDFENARPWSGTLGDFDCELKSNELSAKPLTTFHNVQDARSVIEPHLRGWELNSELNENIRIQFNFASAIVDKSDPASSSTTVDVHAVDLLLIAGEATAHISHGNYPSPPRSRLEHSRFVEDLLERVRELRTRSHPMLFVAYLFLTQLEYECGDRKQAAIQLNVDLKILQAIGRLSVKNDPDERRKVKGPADPLTEAERQWLFAVLPRLTWHIAQVESSQSPPQLRMSDLPTL